MIITITPGYDHYRLRFQAFVYRLLFVIVSKCIPSYKGLVTNYGEGGGYKTGGGHVKFYPYKKKGGGGGNSFSHAEGGAQQVLS